MIYWTYFDFRPIKCITGNQGGDMQRYLILSVVILLFFGLPKAGYPGDIIKLAPSFSPSDQRYNYPDMVLKSALDATLESDGPYTISYGLIAMERNRALAEIIQGDLLNVHIGATRKEWEEKAIPIRVPV